MRYAFSETEWKIIQPILPNKSRGIPRVDDRRILNGIFWVLRSGAPWRDLPDHTLIHSRSQGSPEPSSKPPPAGQSCEQRPSARGQAGLIDERPMNRCLRLGSVKEH